MENEDDDIWKKWASEESADETSRLSSGNVLAENSDEEDGDGEAEEDQAEDDVSETDGNSGMEKVLSSGNNIMEENGEEISPEKNGAGSAVSENKAENKAESGGEEKDGEEERNPDTDGILNEILERRKENLNSSGQNESGKAFSDVDLNAEAEEYSSSDSGGLDFSDLNDYEETGAEEDGSSSSGDEGSSFSSEKGTFDDIAAGSVKRTPFKSGRLNSNYFFAVAGAAALLVLVIFGVQRKMNSRQQKASGETAESDMNTSSNLPDFGNYEERRYKETQADKNKKDFDYINQTLTAGNKEPYVSPSVPQSASSVPVASGYAGTSWQEARDASLRYAGSGFGSRNTGQSPASFLQNQFAGAGGQAGLPMSKSEYASEYLRNIGNVSGSVQGGGSSLSSYDIVNNGRYSNAGAYDRTKAGGNINSIPDNSVYPGTVLQAVLVSGINTDYPGAITARIISPVYDSRYGQTLLIPQGSILRGSYSSSSIGIAKVQIAWESLIINRDGMDYTVELGSMAGVDKRGYSGIKGSLNDHWFQYIRAAGMSALFTMINYNIFSYSNARSSKVQQEMIGEAQSVGQSLADRLLERALDIQPTVVVKPGTRVNVDVDKILTLVPLDRDVTAERYIRK